MRRCSANAGSAPTKVRIHRATPHWLSTERDRSDDGAFGARGAAAEAVGGERRDVNERRPAEVEISQDLSDGGALQEAVAGEPGRVEEAAAAGRGRRLAEQGVVVRGDLVQPGPAGGDSDVEQ